MQIYVSWDSTETEMTILKFFLKSLKKKVPEVMSTFLERKQFLSRWLNPLIRILQVDTS